MTASPYYDQALAYLEDKHTTLWADWDITRPDRRILAAEWLSAQVQGVLAQRAGSTTVFTDPAGTHVPGREYREAEPAFTTAVIDYGQQPERF